MHYEVPGALISPTDISDISDALQKKFGVVRGDFDEREFTSIWIDEGLLIQEEGKALLYLTWIAESMLRGMNLNEISTIPD